MEISVRPVREEEYGAYGRAIAMAFGADYDEARQAHERELLPLEDTLGAFAEDLLVGTEGILRMTLSIPGGQVPMAGITSVSVLPTHHRRGILTAMMRRRLERLTAEGQWLAGLWASESAIYGRFGFGIATERAALEVETRRTAFTHPLVDPGAVRLVEKEEALTVVPGIYATAAAGWPGMIAREPSLWTHLWRDDPKDRGGSTALLFVVHATAGVDDGYAVYRTRLDWGSGSDTVLTVEELVTVSDWAYAALWRFLLDVDLMPRLVAYRRPVDEALHWMLAERHSVRVRPDEGLWLRLVAIAPALKARRYSAQASLVLEVADSFCPWNAGRYLLRTSAAGEAESHATSDPADLQVGAADLAAAYLGGVSFFTLARAGRVVERTPGAIRRADAMFRWHRAPWCDRIF